MRVNRIFCDGPLASGAEVSLPAAGAHHVARVLRMREGAALSVFDGNGREFRAEIVRLQGDQVTVRLGDQACRAQESPLTITLVQGVSRGERMDWTLQKATELGVAVIAPVLTARSVVRLDDRQAARKQAHWRGIVVGACEQCGRATVPAVLEPLDLHDYLASTRKEGLRLVLSPTAPASLAGITTGSLGSSHEGHRAARTRVGQESDPEFHNKIELLIGPEGGLDDNELIAAGHAGFVPVRLGPRVLRTETAAIAALSVLQALWGDLR